MKLSGNQIKELREALTNAYPSKASLKMLIRESDLDKNLEEIAFGENLNEIIFEIIEWAESRNKLYILINAAYEANNDNEKLKAFVEKTPLVKYWQKIKPILENINNKKSIDLIGSACRYTLNNSDRYKGDIEGEFPESINPRIDDIKKIFLQKYIYNDKQIIAIVEFAERLAKDVKEPNNVQLKKWIKSIAEELCIQIPTYTQSLTNTSQNPLQSYLLIVVDSQGENEVSLNAELIRDYQSEQDLDAEPINIVRDKPVVNCSFTEIAYYIYIFLQKSIEELNLVGQSYNLTIEIFLPFKFLHENIEFQEVNIDNEQIFIGDKNCFVLRSLERYDAKKEYINKLRQKWKILEEFMNSSQFNDENVKQKFYSLDKFENFDFKELSYNLQYENTEKIGLKVTCCLPKSEEEKSNFFRNIFDVGIPLFLWTRRNDIIDINMEFDQLLSKKALENYLIDSVHKLRKYACIKKNKEDFLGYHIGFLCDNPYRIPYHLTSKYYYS